MPKPKTQHRPLLQSKPQHEIEPERFRVVAELQAPQGMTVRNEKEHDRSDHEPGITNQNKSDPQPLQQKQNPKLETLVAREPTPTNIQIVKKSYLRNRLGNVAEEGTKAVAELPKKMTGNEPANLLRRSSMTSR
jgi:hypothetical protein